MNLRTSVASARWRRVVRAAAPLTLMAIVAGLAGCGQKGPLTLPAAPAGAASAPASR